MCNPKTCVGGRDEQTGDPSGDRDALEDTGEDSDVQRAAGVVLVKYARVLGEQFFFADIGQHFKLVNGHLVEKRHFL